MMESQFVHRFKILYLLLLTTALLGLMRVHEAQSDWQEEWESAVKAAEEEGILNVAPVGSSWYPVFMEAFQEKFPNIKVVMLPRQGPGPQDNALLPRGEPRGTSRIFILVGVSRQWRCSIPIRLSYPSGRA